MHSNNELENLKRFGLKYKPALFLNTIKDDIYDPLPKIDRLNVSDIRKISSSGSPRPSRYKYVILPDGELILTSEYSAMMELPASNPLRKQSTNLVERLKNMGWWDNGSTPIRKYKGVNCRAVTIMNTDIVYFDPRGENIIGYKVKLLHPEVAGLKPVIAAGDVYVVGGKITKFHPSGLYGIDNWTGHYLTWGNDQQKLVEHVFKQNGFHEAHGAFRDRVADAGKRKMPQKSFRVSRPTIPKNPFTYSRYSLGNYHIQQLNPRSLPHIKLNGQTFHYLSADTAPSSMLKYNSSIGIYSSRGEIGHLNKFIKSMKPHNTNSFLGGSFHVQQLDHPMTVYRTGKIGKYWCTSMPKSPWQHSLDLGMHPAIYPNYMKVGSGWHPANSPVLVYKVPKGEIVAIGKVAPQNGWSCMGEQVYIASPNQAYLQKPAWRSGVEFRAKNPWHKTINWGFFNPLKQPTRDKLIKIWNVSKGPFSVATYTVDFGAEVYIDYKQYSQHMAMPYTSGFLRGTLKFGLKLPFVPLMPLFSLAERAPNLQQAFNAHSMKIDGIVRGLQNRGASSGEIKKALDDYCLMNPYAKASVHSSAYLQKALRYSNVPKWINLMFHKAALADPVYKSYRQRAATQKWRAYLGGLAIADFLRDKHPILAEALSERETRKEKTVRAKGLPKLSVIGGIATEKIEGSMQIRAAGFVTGNPLTTKKKIHKKNEKECRVLNRTLVDASVGIQGENMLSDSKEKRTKILAKNDEPQNSPLVEKEIQKLSEVMSKFKDKLESIDPETILEFKGGPEQIEKLREEAVLVEEKVTDLLSNPALHESVADVIGQVSNTITSMLQQREMRERKREEKRQIQGQHEQKRIISDMTFSNSQAHSSASLLSSTLLVQTTSVGQLPGQLAKLTTMAKEYREHMAIVRDRLPGADAMLKDIESHAELLDRLGDKAIKSYRQAIKKKEEISKILGKCEFALSMLASALNVASSVCMASGVGAPVAPWLSASAAIANAEAAAIRSGDSAIKASQSREERRYNHSLQRTAAARDYLNIAKNSAAQQVAAVRIEERRNIQNLLSGGLSESPSEYRKNLVETVESLEKGVAREKGSLASDSAKLSNVALQLTNLFKELREQERLGQSEHGKEKKKADRKAKKLREKIAKLEAEKLALQSTVSVRQQNILDDTRVLDTVKERAALEERLAPLCDRVWDAIERADGEWQGGTPKDQEFRERIHQLAGQYEAVRQPEQRTAGELLHQFNTIAHQLGAHKTRQCVQLGQQLYRVYDRSRYLSDVSWPALDEAIKSEDGSLIGGMRKIGVIQGVTKFILPSLEIVSATIAITQVLDALTAKPQIGETALELTMQGIHQLENRMAHGFGEVHRHLYGMEDRLLQSNSEIKSSVVETGILLSSQIASNRKEFEFSNQRSFLVSEVRDLELQRSVVDRVLKSFEFKIKHEDKAFLEKDLLVIIVDLQSLLSQTQSRTKHAVSWSVISTSHKHAEKFSDRFTSNSPNLYRDVYLSQKGAQLIALIKKHKPKLFESKAVKRELGVLQEKLRTKVKLATKLLERFDEEVLSLYKKQCSLYEVLLKRQASPAIASKEFQSQLLSQQAQKIDAKNVESTLVAEKRFQLSKAFQRDLNFLIPELSDILPRYLDKVTESDIAKSRGKHALMTSGTQAAVMFGAFGFCVGGPAGAVFMAGYFGGGFVATSAVAGAALAAGGIFAEDRASGDGLTSLRDNLNFWRHMKKEEKEGPISTSSPSIRQLVQSTTEPVSKKDKPFSRRVLRATFRISEAGDWVSPSLMFQAYNRMDGLSSDTGEIAYQVDLSSPAIIPGTEIFSINIMKRKKEAVQIGDFRIAQNSPFTHQDLSSAHDGPLKPEEAPAFDQYRDVVKELVSKYLACVKEVAGTGSVECDLDGIPSKALSSQGGETLPLIFPEKLIRSLTKKLGSDYFRFELSGAGSLIPLYSFDKVGDIYELRINFHFLNSGEKTLTPYAHFVIGSFDQQTVLSFSNPSCDRPQPNIDEFLMVAMYGENLGLPGKRSRTLSTGEVTVADESFPGLFSLLNSNPESSLLYNSQSYAGEPTMQKRKPQVFSSTYNSIMKTTASSISELDKLHVEWSESYHRVLTFLSLNTGEACSTIGERLGQLLSVRNPTSIQDLWLQTNLFATGISQEEFNRRATLLIKKTKCTRSQYVKDVYLLRRVIETILGASMESSLNSNGLFGGSAGRGGEDARSLQRNRIDGMAPR